MQNHNNDKVSNQIFAIIRPAMEIHNILIRIRTIKLPLLCKLLIWTSLKGSLKHTPGNTQRLILHINIKTTSATCKPSNVRKIKHMTNPWRILACGCYPLYLDFYYNIPKTLSHKKSSCTSNFL